MASSDLTRTVIVDYKEYSVSLNKGNYIYKDNSLIFDKNLSLDDYYNDLMDISDINGHDVRDVIEDIKENMKENKFKFD